MPNQTILKGLPDFDSPTLEEEIERIADSDRELQAQISKLLENFNWHEKMAVCQTAVFFIDNTHHKLLKLIPIHGELSEPLTEAMRLVEGLSPQALAELAEDILQEDFEGEIEVENES
jgi:hypothetical protein